jgi:hypothetical protein
VVERFGVVYTLFFPHGWPLTTTLPNKHTALQKSQDHISNTIRKLLQQEDASEARIAAIERGKCVHLCLYLF